jgi:Ser-tRNA(Ala) deacylase AlaX
MVSLYILVLLNRIMTKKLFYDDPYLTECDALVLRVDGAEVLLDKTIFFAFSGGQASDRGKINDINVKNAVVSDSDIIYALEREPDFKVGDSVHIVIDSARRMKLMRLHSAAHIVHFFFSEKTGIHELIGSNIDIEKARLDYAISEPVSALLPEIEEKMKKVTEAENEIKTYDENEKRVWFMVLDGKEIKYNCCGTHVRSTKEIGPVKLKRKNLGSGKERIEITLV